MPRGGGGTTCNIISVIVETFVLAFSGLVHILGSLFGCILHTFYSFVMLLEPVLAKEKQQKRAENRQNFADLVQYHSKAFQEFTTIAL